MGRRNIIYLLVTTLALILPAMSCATTYQGHRGNTGHCSAQSAHGDSHNQIERSTATPHAHTAGHHCCHHSHISVTLPVRSCLQTAQTVATTCRFSYDFSISSFFTSEDHRPPIV